MQSIMVMFLMIIIFLFSTISIEDSKAGESKIESKVELSEIEKAYQREFVFLQSQLRELKRQQKTQNERHQQQTQAAKTQILQLRQQALSLTQNNDLLQHQLDDLSEESSLLAENKSLVETTLEQAKTTLGGYHVEVPQLTGNNELEVIQKQLSWSFSSALQLIKDKSQVKIGSGEYFDRSGNKVQGPLLYMGQVAAFGLVENHQGILVPAGQGRFQLHPEEIPIDTAGLKQMNYEGILPVFLFENLERPFHKAEGKDLFQVLEAGGPIGYVIVALGLLALLLAFLRTSNLKRLRVNDETDFTSVITPLRNKSIVEAELAAEKMVGSYGRVLPVVIRHLDKGKTLLEDAVSEQLIIENRKLEQFGTMIIVFASVAPLLGLLGTVTGMISTFDVITEFGTGDPKMLSGGISEALVTTKFGLVVAIPALLFGNFLSGWAKRIRGQLEASILKVINIYEAANDNREKEQ